MPFLLMNYWISLLLFPIVHSVQNLNLSAMAHNLVSLTVFVTLVLAPFAMEHHVAE